MCKIPLNKGGEDMEEKKMGACILCPIYEKERDFNYALEFYASKLKYKIKDDLIFVFSYDEHKQHFEEKFHIKFPGEQLKYLVIPDELNKYKSPVTVKKLFGVFSLYKEYNFIGVVDCECLFTKSTNLNDIFEEIWNKQSFLFANRSYLLHDILKTTVKRMDLLGNEELRKDTSNYLYNCWFCDIPVYNSVNIEEFKDWLYQKNVDELFNDRKITDYYLYVLFLYLEKGYRFKKINYWSPWGIMEDVAYTHPKKCDYIENEIGTHWTSNPESKNANAVIRFHRDHQIPKKEFKKFLWESRLKYIGRRYLSFLIKIKNWAKI